MKKITAITSLLTGILLSAWGSYYQYLIVQAMKKAADQGDIAPSLVAGPDSELLLLFMLGMLTGIVGLIKQHPHRKWAFLGVFLSLFGFFLSIFPLALFIQ